MQIPINYALLTTFLNKMMVTTVSVLIAWHTYAPPPVNHSDTNQSWASVSSCMQKR